VEVLKATFPGAEIEVQHDLLGAARAACGAEAGIACILGTGSNTCLYDGERVTDNVTNLGWLLGDEGSGVDLGKRLIRAYSYRELPETDRLHFEESTGHNRQSIGDGLYGPGNANRFLAGFSPFIHDNINRAAIRQIVVDAFTEFLQRHVLKYDNARHLPISFIGSIAHHYQDILKDVCRQEGLRCANITQKPIDALVHYHEKQHQIPQ
jgi:N-acetylglucosamine kinase-like BadF-type ATPase